MYKRVLCLTLFNQLHHVTAHERALFLGSGAVWLCSSLQPTKNNKCEKNSIWFKQGSGYHAISIHAELFNSYSLRNQILLFEMQQGTKKTLCLASRLTSSLSTQRRHSSGRYFKVKDTLGSALLTFAALFCQCLLFKCDWCTAFWPQYRVTSAYREPKAVFGFSTAAYTWFSGQK